MKNSWIIMSVLAVLSVLIHIIPPVAYGIHPLGYDTGFYRRYLIQPFVQFPNTPVPGLGADVLGPRMFLDFLRFFSFPADIILYGAYIFLFVVSAAAVFFLGKYYGNTHTGLLAAIFFIISPVQYTAYWFMFFKNAFALPLMIAAFLALERGSRLAIPLGILIAFSHHTTSIIFLLTVGVFVILNREKRNIALQTFAVTFFSFLYLHYSSIQEYLNSPVAVFINSKEYFILSLPFLLLSFFGIKEFIAKSRSVIFAFFIITAAFPLFALPFYERIFIFTDIVLIIVAVFGIQKIVDDLKTNRKIMIRLTFILLICFLSFWLVINTYGQIQKLRPLVSVQEIEELRSISRHVAPDTAIITSTVLAPWVHGWSQNKIFAPGLLHDTRSVQEWVSFSGGSRKTKINFLKSFPRPLYIFLSSPEKETFLANLQDCVMQESIYLFRYKC